MVARIRISNTLTRNFFYNENKVKEKVADCTLAANYPMDTNKTTTSFRLKMLQKFAMLNENIKTNSVHISLNFSPSETSLSNETLNEIAIDYMKQIGFGAQPFLVYRHHDAGHPHIHILSVKIDKEGKGIATHNIGKNQSEQARREIEQRFHLVKAEEQKQAKHVLQSAYVAKIVYGKTESRKAIAAVLNHIVTDYKFCSLAELNAVLHLYNVHADKGQEGSRTALHQGLYYHILDHKGKLVGVPIKASLFPNKPTLSFLQTLFLKNKGLNEPYKKALKNAIDFYFIKNKSPDIKSLITALDKEGIHTVLRQSDHGSIYGITFIDHRSKCVFNGSDLGKSYSAKNILERCLPKLEPEADAIKQYRMIAVDSSPNTVRKEPAYPPYSEDAWTQLLAKELPEHFVPAALKKRKKKKRKIN